jgi:hypothetical protein
MITEQNLISKDNFMKGVLYLLHETFEGSPAQGSAYLDRGVGLFNTLDNISAEQASHEVNSMTIAAQTEHLKFYLDRLCEFINGQTEKVNWEESWLIEDVNRDEWIALRDGLKKSYQGVLQCLANVTEWNEERIGEAMAMLAHTAYHFGAIRQILKAV